MGKTSMAKPHRVILRLPLPKIHYYHNKRLQVKESQYLIPYPNTQLNLFCSNNLSFSMHSSQYMTNQSMRRSEYVTYSPTWEGCWLQSSSVHQHDEDHETLWLQNPIAYKRSSFFKRKMNEGKFCLQSQFAWTKLCLILAQPFTALKIILIYI